MRNEIAKILFQSLEKIKKEQSWPFELPKAQVDYPKDEKFGDYSTNIALVLAKKGGKNPMELAEEIASNIKCHSELVEPACRQAGAGNLIRSFDSSRNQDDSVFEKIEVVAPGYINFHLKKEYFQNKIAEINEKKNKFGNSEMGNGKKVQIEFISSNPTGPIHLGNARGGPIGDSLGRIMEKVGFGVTREFYVNDFGNQVVVLGHSILKDEKSQYSGDYIDNLANKLKTADLENASDAKVVGIWAANEILNSFIKPTCEKLDIRFDNWFSEKNELHEKGLVDEAIKLLEERELVYEKERALWFKSTVFGDDKDRVLVKSDSSKTYIAADFAYHKNKIERKFDKLINIQGADHHKEVSVVKAFIEDILGEKGKFDSILTQFVRVMKDGKEVKMSKRKGVYFAIDDLVEEVGKDAVRFIFGSYAAASHINFDINLAKEHSEKNPVFYVQYAHARICSILRKAGEQGINFHGADMSKIIEEKELSLIREMNKLPELIEEIAGSYEVHKLPHYAIKLADKFHSFYNELKVIDEQNYDLTKARLGLINAVRIALAETLGLIGVSAPERM